MGVHKERAAHESFGPRSVRRNVGLVDADRLLFRPVHRPPKERPGLPDGRPQHEHAARRSKFGGQFYFGYHCAGGACGNLHQRHPILV